MRKFSKFLFVMFIFLLGTKQPLVAMDTSSGSKKTPTEDKESFGKLRFSSLNIFVQFLLPFIIFQIFVWSSGELSDRTSYPWGFFSFPSYFQGIFYPINRVYGSFMYIKQPPWESISYVGLVGSIGFFTLIVNMVKRYKKESSIKSIFKITDNIFLNILV